MVKQKSKQFTINSNYSSLEIEEVSPNNVFTSSFREQVVNELEQRGMIRKSELFENCCKNEIIVQCKNCNFPLAIPIGCKLRICPECRIKENNKLKERYKSVVQKWKFPKLITLTLKNYDVLTPEVITEVRNYFSKLRRREFIDNKLFSGIYSIEAKKTKGNEGWNIHIHCLANCFYIDQGKLSETWKDITTNSKVVDIRKVKNPEQGLNEVLNYIAKEGEIQRVEDLVTYEKVMANRKQIQGFGKVYNKTEREQGSRECPECGYDFWEFMGVVTDNRTNVLMTKDEVGLRECLSSLDTRKHLNTEITHKKHNTMAKTNYEEILTKEQEIVSYVRKNPDYNSVVNRFGEEWVNKLLSRGVLFEPKHGVLKLL